MTTTIVDTSAIPFTGGPDESFADILNRELCGAIYSHGTLRLLNNGAQFDAASDKPMHQIFYFLDGQGVITLDSKKYEVTKGGGVYLAPSEAAKINQAGVTPLKLFHLTVLKKAN